MSQEITITGGRSIMVILDELEKALEVSKRISRELYQHGSRTSATTSALAYPRGSFAALAHTNRVPRLTLPFSILATDMRQLGDEYDKLADNLTSVLHYYINTEEFINHILQQKGFFETLRDAWDSITPDVPFLDGTLIFGDLIILEQLANPLDRRSVFQRLVHNDLFLPGNNPFRFAVGTVFHEQEIWAAYFKEFIDRILFPINAAFYVYDFFNADVDFNHDSMSSAARAILFAINLLGFVDYRGLEIRPIDFDPKCIDNYSAPDLLKGVRELGQTSEAGPGVIEIREHRDADGNKSWTVMIPGTQAWSPTGGSNNPLDNYSNLNLLGMGASEMTVLVASAMSQAGIESDEPVLFVGHSQGGMIAASIIANKDMQKKYNFKGLLTAGSPIGSGFDIPETVEVLSIEHQSDVVPKLDGELNPDRPHWTTVLRDQLYADDAATRAYSYDQFESHTIDAYIETAEFLNEEEFLQVQSWHEEMDNFFPSGGEVVDSTRYQATRVD